MRPKVQGNKIFHRGEVLHLRGTNIIRYGWQWPRNNYSIDVALADMLTRSPSKGGWGGNCFMFWAYHEWALAKDKTYFQYLDKMVEVAMKNDAYPIIAYSTNNGYQDHAAHITPDAITTMVKLAERYKAVENLIMITQSETGFDCEFPRRNLARWLECRDQQEAMIDAVRQVIPDLMFGVTGSNWGQLTHWLVDNPVNRENIFVQPHLYGSHPATAEAAGRAIPELTKRYPIVPGEFGAGTRMTLADTQRLIRTAEEQWSGWIAFNLSDLGRPTMYGDAKSTILTPALKEPLNDYGLLVRDELERIVTTAKKGIEPPFRVNLGGGATSTWAPEQPWTEGSTHGYLGGKAGSTSGTIDGGQANVHSTERYGLSEYRLRMQDPTQRYDVVIHLAEIYEPIVAPGMRVFDIGLEPLTLHDVDPVALAGFGRLVRVVFQGVRPREDGTIAVIFTKKTENPAVKGIEVLGHGEAVGELVVNETLARYLEGESKNGALEQALLQEQEKNRVLTQQIATAKASLAVAQQLLADL